jgi:hypothetical protein
MVVGCFCFFDGYDFNQMVGEVFDELDNSYKDLIVRKLEGPGNSPSNEDPFSQRNNNYTKESKGYQDFSKLM